MGTVSEASESGAYMTSWREQAACKGKNLNLFFAERGTPEHAAALGICAGCPVAEECARDRKGCEGIWGGRWKATSHRRQYDTRCSECGSIFFPNVNTTDTECESCIPDEDVRRRRGRDTQRRIRSQRRNAAGVPVAPWICEGCTKEFQSLSGKLSHQRAQVCRESLACPGCHRVFQSRKSLTKHQRGLCAGQCDDCAFPSRPDCDGWQAANLEEQLAVLEREWSEIA